MPKAVLDRLLAARREPPSVIRLCWPLVPMSILAGAVSVIALFALIMCFAALFAGVMYVGAALCSLGIARKTLGLWLVPLTSNNIEPLTEGGEQRLTD